MKQQNFMCWNRRSFYEIVEDETELRAVADVFENLLEDVSLTDGEEL